MKFGNCFKKNLLFHSGPKHGQSLQQLALQFLETWARYAQEGRPHEPLHACVRLAHRYQGGQVWVSEQVSEDLLRSDILEPDFMGVEWPMRSLEFVFEDPEIPSFLLRKDVDGEDLMGWLAALATGEKAPEANMGYSMVLFGADRSDNSFATGLSFAPEDIDEFALGHYKASMVKYQSQDPENAERLAGAASALCLLAFKVLLFAGTPKFKAVKTMDPPTRKEGGKPGFLNRPRTPRYIVQYLPRQIVERKRETEEGGKRHEFNGRRGHFRTYRDDRFKDKKGQRDYMWPIPDPHGNVPKRIFKVVK